MSWDLELVTEKLQDLLDSGMHPNTRIVVEGCGEEITDIRMEVGEVILETGGEVASISLSISLESLKD